jgi:ATP-dependent Zn protease
MDLPDLSSVSGNELTDEQLRGIVTQIDLDITNLLRDGKLSALRYGTPGEQGAVTDRAANLRSLLDARSQYQKLLEGRPAWVTTQTGCCS